MADTIPTVHAQHIESPTRRFRFRIWHPAYFNEWLHAACWREWNVMASTPQGAHRVARYHFYRSPEELIHLTGEAPCCA